MSRAYGWNAKLLIAEESTTGKEIKIPASKAPKFKAGAVLKNAVK